MNEWLWCTTSVFGTKRTLTRACLCSMYMNIFISTSFCFILSSQRCFNKHAGRWIQLFWTVMNKLMPTQYSDKLTMIVKEYGNGVQLPNTFWIHIHFSRYLPTSTSLQTLRLYTMILLDKCCLLAASRPNNIQVYLGNGSASNIVYAATLR